VVGAQVQVVDDGTHIVIDAQQNCMPGHGVPPPTLPIVLPHVQRPLPHVSMAPHATPHAPQLLVLEARLTQVADAEQQSGVPPVQASAPGPPIGPPEPHWQRPLEHISPMPHALPHAPQFAASELVFTQLAPQHVWPAAHARPLPVEPWVLPHSQRPEAAHVSPVPHIALQPPQLDVVVMSVSQPPPAEQSPQPELQLPTAHMYDAHVAVAWGCEHIVVQEPQYVSVLSCCSQPFESDPSQLP